MMNDYTMHRRRTTEKKKKDNLQATQDGIMRRERENMQ